MSEFEQLITDYIDSIRDDVDQLEQILLSYESSGVKEGESNHILRILHSLKGSSGSYGFRNVSRLCHHFEDHFIHSVEDQTVLDFIDKYLQYVDQFKKFVATAQDLDYVDEGQASRGDEEYIKNVLLVDDSPVYTKMVKHALKNLNARVKVEKDGLNAIDLALTKKYDGIIISTSISGLDGISLLKALKVIESVNSKTPIAMMTSRRNLDLEDSFKPNLHIVKDENVKNNLRGLLENLVTEGGNQEEKVFDYKKVVYLDDTASLHPLVKIGLSGQECDLKCFAKTEEALSYIKSEKPDLILCDYNLNDGVTGSEVFNQIEHYGETFIFLTGEEEGSSSSILAAAPGAQGIIYKPISPKLLVKKILST